MVLTRKEVRALLAHVAPTYRLIADLIYGSGLRLLEALRLRVKDVDFGYGRIIVRDGKGMKDRVTMLPQRLQRPLREHSLTSKPCTSGTEHSVSAPFFYRTRSDGNIPTLPSHGHGNMFSPLRSDRLIR